MTERRKRMSHSHWIEHLETQEASGVSVAEYCRVHDLSVASFVYHRGRVRRAGAVSTDVAGFTEVRLGVGSGLRLSPAGGAWSLELDRDFDADTLRRFLRVLGA
jgi:hypothetical protein